MTLESLYQELEELRRWPENWNSYNAVPVDHAAIDHARIVLTCFYRAARDDWFAPNITADAAEGDVVFEWWYGPRKVTMYISPFSTEYIQVWGNDPKCKIDDGDICSIGDFTRLWHWLHSIDPDPGRSGQADEEKKADGSQTT